VADRGRSAAASAGRRVGVLLASAPGDAEYKSFTAAFTQALQRLGWDEGRTVQIDFRSFAGDGARAQAFAKELVALQPDVIVSQATIAASALLRETRTIPIVFVQVIDPVSQGLMESLARPQGNITGFTNFEPAIGGKWLKLLKDIAPHNAVAVRVHDKAELERAVGEIAALPNSGLVVVPHPFTLIHRELIVALSARHRLPTIYPYRFFVSAGGLLSYGVDVEDIFRDAAIYVDRLLRGTDPRDLPVQAPTRFELVINIKTAKALGLDIPPTLLALADEVIE
jgi:putative tryptophan/tyrosine transport system substrate-binding protein